MGLHSLTRAVWYGRSPLSILLLPAAWVFALLSWLRRLAYRHGFIERPEQSLPVIVVGNISVGGTGKTPVVAWLAGEFARRGYRVGIVSRGYGGAGGATPRMVQPGDTAAAVGDEPLLLARLTGCPVCVCPDRAAAVAELAKHGIDLVLSDDGLQHYRMRRVAEVVVVDGMLGLGNGRLLPAGPLRESRAKLACADVVLVNGAQDSIAVAGTPFELLQTQALQLNREIVRELDEFRGSRVWSVAGIGNPQRFHSALRARGMLVDEVDVPDHGVTDLGSLARRRSQPVLMTQKDAVKYPEIAGDFWYVPVELSMGPDAAGKLVASLEAAINDHKREKQP